LGSWKSPGIFLLQATSGNPDQNVITGFWKSTFEYSNEDDDDDDDDDDNDADTGAVNRVNLMTASFSSVNETA